MRLLLFHLSGISARLRSFAPGEPALNGRIAEQAYCLSALICAISSSQTSSMSPTMP